MTALLLTLGLFVLAPEKTPGPKVDDIAKDFELLTPAGDKVKLSKLAEKQNVVLIVLRGYPGYQCPLCNRQIGDFISKAQSFADAGSQILLVYPGPADQLGKRADEFLKGKKLPDNVRLVIDPDYQFTNEYGLRWDAKQETAYPATYIVDGKLKVRFAKVSTTHGGRSNAPEVLEALKKLK